MKKLKTIAILVLGVSLVACGPNWKRLKNAKSVSIVGITNHDELVPYNESGEKGSDGSGNFGLSEGLGALGAVTSGKGLKGVTDVVAKRSADDQITYDNILVFQKNSLESIKASLIKNKYEVNNYDAIGDIDFKDKQLAISLVEDSNSDVVINVRYAFGYVLKSKNLGMSKEYRLALKAFFQFADKNGLIGGRKYFVISTKRKVTDGKVPAFTSDDFDRLLKSFTMNLTSDIKKITIK